MEPLLFEKLDQIKLLPNTLFLVGFSGGKDSVATVLTLLEIGVPASQIELHHHCVDGGGNSLWDWPCTESYCKAFADHFNLPIFFSWRQGGIHREILRENEGLQPVLIQDSLCSFKTLKSEPGNGTRLKFPAKVASLQTRWCSSCVKIDVMSRVITNTERYKGKNLVICTGERRQESAARAKYKAIEYHRTNTNSRLALHYRPVIELTEQEIWALFAKYGIQPHPCYCLGWPRCSCMTCIFSDCDIWASLFELCPARIDYLDELEQRLGFTIDNIRSIRQMVAHGTSFLLKENLDRWKTEALSEFVSPIYVENWRLPQGAFKHQSAGSI